MLNSQEQPSLPVACPSSPSVQNNMEEVMSSSLPRKTVSPITVALKNENGSSKSTASFRTNQGYFFQKEKDPSKNSANDKNSDVISSDARNSDELLFPIDLS
jgi:hypothetical protein